MNSMHVSPLIRFSVINTISKSVNRFKFTFNFLKKIFKVTCYAIPGGVRKQTGSSSCVSRHIFSKLSHASANNNVSL